MKKSLFFGIVASMALAEDLPTVFIPAKQGAYDLPELPEFIMLKTKANDEIRAAFDGEVVFSGPFLLPVNLFRIHFLTVTELPSSWMKILT